MTSADILLVGGRVIDGSGNPSVRADVAITDGRFSAVGKLGGVHSQRIIDIDGLVVCPGFVDMHAHSDLRILTDSDHIAKVSQGITTEVLGQDGLSYAPMDDVTLGSLKVALRGWNGDPAGLDWDWRTVGEYLDRVDRGVAVNAAYLVPHGSVRMMVMGDSDRQATPDQLAAMGELVSQGLREGAVGLSTGLTYAPAMFADDEELVFLTRIVAELGGYYAPHHRNYGRHAIREYAACIAIARTSRVPLHLTHAHLGYEVNRGRAGELLALVDDALAEGLEVTLDSYPYLASSTYLHALLPPWVQSGGAEQLRERLSDPDDREAIRLDIEVHGHAAFHDVPVSWDAIVIAGVKETANERFVGVDLAESARREGVRPIDLFCDLVLSDGFGTTCIQHAGNEENVRAIMQHRCHTAGSDGILVGERPHPRAWATFPEYLGRYVRELGVLGLEDAIRKFTSLPAQRLGFWDRGLVRVGLWADAVVFDPDTIEAVATYDDPCRPSVGIRHVLVNGELAIEDGIRTQALAGRALRRL